MQASHEFPGPGPVAATQQQVWLRTRVYLSTTAVQGRSQHLHPYRERLHPQSSSQRTGLAAPETQANSFLILRPPWRVTKQILPSRPDPPRSQCTDYQGWWSLLSYQWKPKWVTWKTVKSQRFISFYNCLKYLYFFQKRDRIHTYLGYYVSVQHHFILLTLYYI